MYFFTSLLSNPAFISHLAFDSFPEILGKMIPVYEIEFFKKVVRPAFEKYKGIGVRIEDDILITTDGYKNLSDKILKGIDDVERIMIRY